MFFCPKELKEIFMVLGKKHSDDEILKMIKLVDLNGDGKVLTMKNYFF